MENVAMADRYIIVGGHPYRSYTGTITFTHLNIVGKTDSKREAEKIVSEKYDDCGGLLVIIDLESGDIVYEN